MTAIIVGDARRFELLAMLFESLAAQCSTTVGTFVWADKDTMTSRTPALLSLRKWPPVSSSAARILRERDPTWDVHINYFAGVLQCDSKRIGVTRNIADGLEIASCRGATGASGGHHVIVPTCTKRSSR